MKKFAIIPATEDDYKDKYFFPYESVLEFKSEAAREFYNGFSKRGDIIHTIDMYYDISEPDYYLFLWPDWEWAYKLMKIGVLQRAIYCNSEPPTVISLNKPAGFKFLKLIFSVILTYNRDWVDNIHVFKRNIPYIFNINIDDSMPISQKKLLTGISADKKSNYKDELYSERKKAYLYFEKYLNEQFVFYGTRWRKKGHPCYGGIVENKARTFHGFKFALCLENTKNIKDYVTEKMLDCICAGIVPIYAGAKNILEYIPQDCFIDYFSFDSLDSLASYLISMDETAYCQYLHAAKKWLISDAIVMFGYKIYFDDLYFAINHKKKTKVGFQGKLLVILFFVQTKVKKFVENKKRVLKHYIIEKLTIT